MWSRFRAEDVPVAFDSAEARRHRLRERTAPRRGDPFYVHLVDLRDALAGVLGEATGVWLDYGADTSPYGSLLGGAELRSADLPRTGGRVDYLLDDSGRLAVPNATFDGVLSTQVVEHVPDAGACLREARRVLKPSGRLVITTHGIWEDHAGPLDLRRWTLSGLARDVSEAGFRVLTCEGVTCRRRAALFLGQQQFLPRAAPVRRALDAVSDQAFRSDRRRGDDASLYLTILLTAVPTAP